jgi:hypothetical protein
VDREVSAKDAALEQIAALTAAHGITVEEIDEYLQRRPRAARGGGLVAQLLAYLGGAFVFSGIGLLISFIWDDIGSAQRVILTFGTGLAAMILGMVSVRDVRFERAAAPLFLVAAFLQPFGLFVFLDEYMPQAGNPVVAAMAVFGTLAIQHALIFEVLRRSTLLFLGTTFGVAFLSSTLEFLDVDGEVAAVIVGLVALGAAWLVAQTSHVAVAPPWYFVGGGLLIGGWWAWFEGTAIDLSTLGLCVALVAVSIRAASRTLLFVSVVGLLAYLSYFAYEYFADVVGWPIALIVLGLAMIGIGGWAMKLGRTLIGAPSTARP